MGKNNTKFTNEYVYNFYKEKGCILLDEYINSKTKMNYICKCGEHMNTTFCKFKNQKQGCRKCFTYTHEEVKQYFEEHGCELLDIFINVKVKMKYKCSCGDISEITFDNFKKDKRCNKCGLDKLSEQFRTDINEVKQYFLDNNCVPLFTDYKNDRQKLKYKCECGNPSEITFADFKSGRRCNKCSIARRMETNSQNGNVASSLQQRYIHSIIGGNLNYACESACLDIAFIEDKIYVEYDGSGHDLGVKLKSITQENFNKKEIRRNYALYRRGWKEIRIISSKDKIPTKDKILEIMEYAKEILKNNNYIIFNIDKSQVNFNGVILDYDYGNIKRLRNE